MLCNTVPPAKYNTAVIKNYPLLNGNPGCNLVFLYSLVCFTVTSKIITRIHYINIYSGTNVACLIFDSIQQKLTVFIRLVG